MNGEYLDVDPARVREGGGYAVHALASPVGATVTDVPGTWRARAVTALDRRT